MLAKEHKRRGLVDVLSQKMYLFLLCDQGWPVGKQQKRRGRTQKKKKKKII